MELPFCFNFILMLLILIVFSPGLILKALKRKGNRKKDIFEQKRYFQSMFSPYYRYN